MRWFIPALLVVLLVGCATKQATAPPSSQPSTQSPSQGEGAQPSSTGSSPGAEDPVFFTNANSPQPICPDVADLVQTVQTDEPALRSLAPKMIKELYTSPGYEEYTNLKVALASQAGLHGEMVKKWCGAAVAESTWVVKMTFPKNAPSASMSGGQFMVSKTRKGWQVWFRYH